MKRVISCSFTFLITVSLLISSSIFAFAASDAEYKQKVNFFHWLKGVPLWGDIISYTTDFICPYAEDGHHRASTYQSVDDEGNFKCMCSLCGNEFTAYESDLKQSYETSVSELPATGYQSDGSLLWHPSATTGSAIYHHGGAAGSRYYPFTSLPFEVMNGTSSNGTVSLFDSGVVWPIKNTYIRHGMLFSFTVPMSGSYRYLDSTKFTANCLLSDGNNFNFTDSYVQQNFVHYDADVSFDAYVGIYIYGSRGIPDTSVSYGTLKFFLPVFEVVPDASLSGNIYNIATRPTSITGDYGIIGDDGQVTKVDGDYIINETTNTYYNPATGQTTPITDWSYNYEDRSYTVTTESGDTVTITYGDENVTINEGDTIYNVYYLVDGSGSGSEICAHDWEETSRTEPACTTAGKVTSTCSKCGQTKTEPLPATGHTWIVDRTVQTSYDEAGNLVQQGYTIYKCSVCGEQYKDTQGTGPPGSSGSGGDEDKSIWDKIGDFFGTIGGGFLEIIGAVAGKLLDALVSLAGMLMERLKAIVEAVLSIFSEVPALFGGFLSFLSAVFPFLPAEIITILTFGILAVTFIGILKAVRR